MKIYNPVQEKSLQFALSIMDLTTILRAKKLFDLSRQLFRSGTSIGANIEEALGGQSRKDFINKLSIARKEARETNYWLTLIDRKMPELNVSIYLSQINELLALLTAIIKTSSQNS